MRVLVTGGSGFFGHTLVHHLLAHTTWSVVVLDSLSYAGDPLKLYDDDVWREARALGAADLLYHDLRAPIGDDTAQRIGPVDAIINLASWSHVDRSIEDPVPFVRNNVDLALNLLEYARKLPGLQLFLQFSTDEVYGPAEGGQRHIEWSSIVPSNPYSASKAAQEALAVAWWRTFNVPVLITNTMNLVGPHQHPEKFVPTVIRHVLAGEAVPIHGERRGGTMSRAGEWESGSRCWLSTADAAEAVRFLVERHVGGRYRLLRLRDGVPRPPRYHIVGEELSNLELAERIAKLLGRPLHVAWVDFHKTRPGHDRRYALDGYALAQLGWSPVGLAAELPATVRWYLDRAERLYQEV